MLGGSPRTEGELPEGAILKAGLDEVPEGAVHLTDQEVLGIQVKTMRKWEPKREMYPLLYGSGMLGACATVTGGYFNNFWRNRFKLRQKAFMVTFIPNLFIPTVMALGVNQTFVQVPIMLGNMKCAMCAEIRACSMQAVFGFIQPAFLGAMAAAAGAKLVKSYPVPSVLNNPKETINMYRGFFNKMGFVPLATFLMLNLVAASVITHQQAKASLRLNAKLREDLMKESP